MGRRAGRDFIGACDVGPSLVCPPGPSHNAARYPCQHLRDLIEHTCPGLLDLHGIGPETAAQLLTTLGDNPDRIRTEAAFAALCGVAPIPASSGKTNRHRLSRGGDRQANRALYLITCSRLASCPTTKAYKTRRTTEGKTTQEIIRSLKRYLARELYKVLTTANTPHPAPQQAS